MRLRNKNQKKRLTFNVQLQRKGHGIHEIFISTKTIIAFLGFSVGGLLVGRSLWEYGIEYIGLNYTALSGILVFIISGLILHKFNR